MPLKFSEVRFVGKKSGQPLRGEKLEGFTAWFLGGATINRLLREIYKQRQKLPNLDVEITVPHLYLDNLTGLLVRQIFDFVKSNLPKYQE